MSKQNYILIDNFNTSRNAFFSGGSKLLGDNGLPLVHPNNIDKLHNEDRKFRQMMETEPTLLNNRMRQLKRTLAAEEHAKLCRYYIELSRTLAEYYNREHYNSPQRLDPKGSYNYLNPQAALDKLLDNMDNLDVPEYCRPLTFAGVKEFLQAKKNKAKENISHISSIRTWVGLAHMNRIWFTFFKLTLISSLAETQISGGKDVSKVIAIPTEACNVASAGLLYLRFLMNFYLMWKHVHFGLLLKGAEGRAAFKEELYDEFDKRGENMVNDLVWGTINLLTNFDGTNSVLGKVIDMGSIALPAINPAPIPIANIVTAVFLLFDVAWNTYQWRYRDLPKYKMNKQRLELELNEIKTTITTEIVRAGHTPPEKCESDPRVICDPRYTIAKAKLDELEANWAGQWWQHATCIGAAFFLLVGFSATMFFTGGMAIPICFATVLFGTAMYFCAKSVGDLMAAQKRVSQNNSELKSLQKTLAAIPGQINTLRAELATVTQDNNEQKEILQKRINELEAYQGKIEARIGATRANIKDVKNDRKETVYKFAETIGRNLIMPGLILGVAAFCWPAALAITISYAAGLLALTAYRSYKKSKPAVQDAAVAPPTPVLTRRNSRIWQDAVVANKDLVDPLLNGVSQTT